MDYYLKVLLIIATIALMVGLVMVPGILYIYEGAEAAYDAIKTFVIMTVVSFLFFRLMDCIRGEC